MPRARIERKVRPTHAQQVTLYFVDSCRAKDLHPFLRDVATHAEERTSGIADPIERAEAYLEMRAVGMSTMSQDCYQGMMSGHVTRSIYRLAVEASAQLVAEHLRQVVEAASFRTVDTVFVDRAATLLADGLQSDDLPRLAPLSRTESRRTLIHLVLAALTTNRWPSSSTVLSLMEGNQS